jgi:hypothetical protein
MAGGDLKDEKHVHMPEKDLPDLLATFLKDNDEARSYFTKLYHKLDTEGQEELEHYSILALRALVKKEGGGKASDEKDSKEDGGEETKDGRAKNPANKTKTLVAFLRRKKDPAFSVIGPAIQTLGGGGETGIISRLFWMFLRENASKEDLAEMPASTNRSEWDEFLTTDAGKRIYGLFAKYFTELKVGEGVTAFYQDVMNARAKPRS